MRCRSCNSKPKNGRRELLSIETLLPPTAQPTSPLISIQKMDAITSNTRRHNEQRCVRFLDFTVIHPWIRPHTETRSITASSLQQSCGHERNNLNHPQTSSRTAAGDIKITILRKEGLAQDHREQISDERRLSRRKPNQSNRNSLGHRHQQTPHDTRSIGSKRHWLRWLVTRSSGLCRAVLKEVLVTGRFQHEAFSS